MKLAALALAVAMIGTPLSALAGPADDVAAWKEKLVGMTVDEAYKSAYKLTAKGEVAPEKPVLKSSSGQSRTYEMAWDTVTFVFSTGADKKIVSFAQR